MKLKTVAVVSILAILLLFSCNKSSKKEDKALDNYFEGKTVKIYVPFKEGGGTDTFARLFLPYLEKYLPGNPTVLVLNYPGGGGITGANKFKQDAKDDGLLLLGMSASTIFSKLLGSDLANFNFSDFRALVLSPSPSYLYARTDLLDSDIKDKSIQEIIKEMSKIENIKFSFASPSSSAVADLWQARALGLNVDPVNGLSGNDARQAFLRGELKLKKGAISEIFEMVEPMIEENEAFIIYNTGIYDDDANLVRDNNHPETPTFPELYELIRGKKLEGDDLEVFNVGLKAGALAGKSLLLPNSTPEEVLKIWFETLDKILQDTEFNQRRAKITGPYELLKGKQADQVFADLGTLPDSAKREFNKLYEEMNITFRIK